MRSKAFSFVQWHDSSGTPRVLLQSFINRTVRSRSITNQSRHSVVRRCGGRPSSCCWWHAGRTGGAIAPPPTWTAGILGRTAMPPGSKVQSFQSSVHCRRFIHDLQHWRIICEDFNGSLPEHSERGHPRNGTTLSAGTGRAELDLPVLPRRRCHVAVESQT